MPLLVEKATRRDVDNDPAPAPAGTASDAAVRGEIGGSGLSPLPTPMLD
ncbi:hypothetical protein P3H15_48270 [Rhodococcus sp. T2V]|nr:hypothetical protein [Rhodococcus sp. T2V]